MASFAATSVGPVTDLEVATISSDTLRAAVRVVGSLTVRSTPLLTSVVSTHVTAGRRYLRIELAGAHVAEPIVLESLVAVHAMVRDLGGMLVFENAGPCIVDAVRNASLSTRPVHA